MTERSGVLAIGPGIEELATIYKLGGETHETKVGGQAGNDPQANPWRGNRQARLLVRPCTRLWSVAKNERRGATPDLV